MNITTIAKAGEGDRTLSIYKHTLRAGSAFKHCSKFHTKVVNGRKREFYYHATKGWRNRAA